MRDAGLFPHLRNGFIDIISFSGRAVRQSMGNAALHAVR